MLKLFLLLIPLISLLSPLTTQCETTDVIEPVYEINIGDFNEQCIEISWNETCDSEVTYHLYGSDKPVFHLESSTLIDCCKETMALIHPEYPYYYVLVSKEGKLSEPSPRISLKDFFCESKSYVQSPLVPNDVWDSVRPYLLPEDHPAKAALDRIFSRTRVLSSLTAMKEAGFIKPTLLRRGLIVGKHPDLPGYLLKMFLDNSPKIEWQNWLERINGALIVKAAVDRYNYHDIMKVPNKWIYPLPIMPLPLAGALYPKSFVIVVEDMELIPMSQTVEKYKSGVSKSQLKALFNILYDCKMTDSMLPKNVPFSVDGKIAFVDTEHTGKSPMIKLVIRRFRKYLSSSKKDYWDYLCDQVNAKTYLGSTEGGLEPVMLEDSVNGFSLNQKSWQRPQSIPEDVWEQVKPYLLPENHPAKAVLDNIFSSSRVLSSLEEVEKAGFFRNKLNRKKMLVTGHPRLKGFLIKAYLDNFTCEVWHEWTRRARGAKLVQECIDRHNYNNIFKVAKKWIYPLPDNSQDLSKTGDVSQHFILLVQDLGIVSKEANSYRYLNFIKPYHLDALYTTVMECLLYDSMVIENIPFCFDNKIAFVDTEMFNMVGTPKKLNLLNRALSSSMKKYWLNLINQGGPKAYANNELEPECEAIGF